MDAIRILMEEHQLILRGLQVGRRMAARLRGDGEVAAEDVAALADFLSEYADHHHHAKEEDVLFPWMVAQGFPADSGPLACMTHEHVLGRKLRQQIADGAPGLPGTAPQVAHALEAFADLLQDHIAKEDQVLYPMAERLGDGDPELLPRYREAIPDPDPVEARFRDRIAALEARYTKEPSASSGL